MTDTDKKIEAAMNEWLGNNGNEIHERDFKAGAKAGIKLERERSQKLVEALQVAQTDLCPELCALDNPNQPHCNACLDISKALAEYQAEGSGDE